MPDRRLTIVKSTPEPICRHQDSGHGLCGGPNNGEACWVHRDVGRLDCCRTGACVREADRSP
jgi:hypothetical protein